MPDFIETDSGRNIMNTTRKEAMTAGEEREIAIALIRAIPSNLSTDAAIRWSNSQDLLMRKVRAILLDDGARNTKLVLSEWELLYHTMFGLQKDFSRIEIPKQPRGLNRLVIRAQEATESSVMAVSSHQFPLEYHPLGEFGDDFDTAMRNNHRPKEDYAFWVRDVTEAEMPPVADMEELPVPRLTLLERMLLELKYFQETSSHLDTEKVTCCFGTEHSESKERPVVCFRQGKVQIFWQASQYTNTLMSCSPYWFREMSL